MSRAIEYTCVCFLLSTQAAVAAPLDTSAQSREVPLAYVRRLAMPRVTVRVTSSEGATGTRSATARSADRQKELGARAAEMLDAALRRGVSQLGGCTLASEVPGPIWPDSSDAGSHGRRSGVGGADAILAIAVDRFGVRTAFFRDVWLRAVAYVLIERTGELRGPVYAVGLGRSAPRLVRAGFMRSDEEILEEAVADASARLIRALDRGETPLFAADVRVAVVPSRVPDHALVRDADGGSARPLPVPALKRQSDVLFQPDVGPVAVLLPPAEVQSALKTRGIDIGDLWAGSTPNMPAIVELGRSLRADYLFMTAVSSASIGTFTGEDGFESIGDAAEVSALGVLVGIHDRRSLWVSEKLGSARSHIVTPEGSRRIRNSEQCVMDAAVAAMASVRFALEEWMRRRKN
ncbi:MAG: hypothetical protein GX446_14720 [Chthonomonadales bacterium]|nr:hypothetical protein [Chthonomonadales bacterium]